MNDRSLPVSDRDHPSANRPRPQHHPRPALPHLDARPIDRWPAGLVEKRRAMAHLIPTGGVTSEQTPPHAYTYTETELSRRRRPRRDATEAGRTNRSAGKDRGHARPRTSTRDSRPLDDPLVNDATYTIFIVASYLFTHLTCAAVHWRTRHVSACSLERRLYNRPARCLGANGMRFGNNSTRGARERQ